VSAQFENHGSEFVMKRLILVFVICTAFPPNQVAAQTLAQKLDALLASTDLNGNVLVAENGRASYERSYGYADIAARIPNTPDSAFQTASVAKVFTSTAVLQLHEKGKLKLVDAVVKHLPDFPFPTISIRDLLSHTSGLPDLEMYEPLVKQNPDLVIRNSDVIAALKLWNRPLRFQPGEKYSYSNTNYVVLALVVETASRVAFAEYLKQNIFDPAEMHATFVRTGEPATRNSAVVKNHMLATMYKTVPEAVETVRLKDPVKMRRIKYESYNLGLTLGDQNVISTTRDLLRFDQALTAGKLLRQSSLDLAFAPTKLNNGQTYYEDFGVQYGKCSYGLGWIVCDSPTGKTVSHDGFNRGIAVQFYRNLTKRRTVVMFDNTEGAGFDRKVAAVVSILNGHDANLKIKKSTARHFGETLLDKGPAAALIRFNELRADENYYLDEREINILGYEFLFNEYPAQALESFKLNVLLFPNSFNVYDSYGEALAANGKKAEAILMYRKAIALNPKSEGSIRALQRLEQERH
jgi:CubicO group peptidase (beta-lactamase class C family)